jgi:hypothetical protein
VFPWPIIFKPEKLNKIYMEYESVSQKVLLITESMLQNANQLSHAHLSSHVSSVSGILLREDTSWICSTPS